MADQPSNTLVRIMSAASAARRAGVVDEDGYNPQARAELDALLESRRIEVTGNATALCDKRFPIRYREAAADNAKVREWVTEFQADPANARGLLLLGPTGVGKTWQAYGALRAAVTHPQPVRGVGYRCPSFAAGTYADLMARVRPQTGRDTEEELRKLREVGLLLVDDLAAAKSTDWTEEVTYRLLNGRYEDMKPTIFTTNLPLAELKDAIGDRIASRLAHSCVRIALDGTDRRRAAA